MTTPNFTKGKGRLATDRYDFEAHLEGRNPDAGSSYVHSFRHKASQIDIDNPSLVYGSPADVETALENIKGFIDIFSSIGQGFVTIGDGYNTWHAANGNINYDPAIESIDGILNAVSTYLYSGVGGLTAYDRIKHGGIILIKAGTYIVKDTINIPPGLILLGEGYGTKFVNATGLKLPTVSSDPIAVRIPLTIANGDITATSPVQITYSIVDFPVVTGDKVVVSDYTGITITGGSGANGNVFTVTEVTPGLSFTLDGSTGTGASVGGVVSFSRPMFNVLPQISPDILRSVNDEAIDTNEKFMFSKSSKFVNFLISDNFVENTILGDFNHYTPQNTGTTDPLIFQSAGSNLELLNVYILGRVQFSAAPIVDSATAHAIKLDPTLSSGTILKINDCFIDGFSQPISFDSIGGRRDFLQINNSKIRSHGYLDGNGVLQEKNCIIHMNDNNAIISDNQFYGNHADLYTICYIKDRIATPAAYNTSTISVMNNNFIGGTDALLTSDVAVQIDAAILSAPSAFSDNAKIIAHGNNYNIANASFKVNVDGNNVLAATKNTITGTAISEIVLTSPNLTTSLTNTTVVATTDLDITAPNLTTSLAGTAIVGSATADITAPTTTITASTTLNITAPNLTSSLTDTTIVGSTTVNINTPTANITTPDNGGIINLNGGLYIRTKVVSTSDYTVDATITDHVILVDLTTIAGTAHITLPTPTNGRKIIIKDRDGLAGTYGIIVYPQRTLADSYAIGASQIALYAGNEIALAQSITGDGNSLVACRFYLKKTGAPPGNVRANLYDHSGSFGTTSVPTGGPLASATPISASTLTTSFAAYDFIFPASLYTLVAATNYCIEVEYSEGSVTDYVSVAYDNASSTHPGNSADYVAGWNVFGPDLKFEVITSAVKLETLYSPITLSANFGASIFIADGTNWSKI